MGMVRASATAVNEADVSLPFSKTGAKSLRNPNLVTWTESFGNLAIFEGKSRHLLTLTSVLSENK